MTFTRMHMPVDETTTVDVLPAEAQVFVEDGIQHQLVLTLRDVPSVDRIIGALLDVRDALNRPTGAVSVRHCAVGGGRR